MPFFAVFDKATGELVSTGTDVASDADLTERGLDKVRIAAGDRPPADRDWNPETRAFDKSRPAPPTADQVLSGDADYQAMTAGEKRLARLMYRATTGALQPPAPPR